MMCSLVLEPGVLRCIAIRPAELQPQHKHGDLMQEGSILGVNYVTRNQPYEHSDCSSPLPDILAVALCQAHCTRGRVAVRMGLVGQRAAALALALANHVRPSWPGWLGQQSSPTAYLGRRQVQSQGQRPLIARPLAAPPRAAPGCLPLAAALAALPAAQPARLWPLLWLLSLPLLSLLPLLQPLLCLLCPAGLGAPQWGCLSREPPPE